MTENTVYVNDHPKDETDVYHKDREHATNAVWTSDEYRALPQGEAVNEGLRPCQTCFDVDLRKRCPGCKRTRKALPVNNVIRCKNDDCRVETYRVKDDD
jgi:hypothetical protein